MSLSARLRRKRKVEAAAVGLPNRLLASGLDCLVPTAGLIILFELGFMNPEIFQPREGLFALDHILLLCYEQPMAVLHAPLHWMLLYTAISLVSLGLFETSLGKWAVGLTLREKSGRRASGFKLLLRVAVTWSVPCTLGLAYLWIMVSPERRGWHDSLSGTYVTLSASQR